MKKFGFDIHGVINDDPETFRALASALTSSGHEVHILTGPPQARAVEELKEMGFIFPIHFTHLFSIVDYLKSINTQMWQDAKGNWFSDWYPWDRAKGDYCIRHGIDLHLEDTETYLPFFKTPVARYWSKDKRKHHLPVIPSPGD